MASGTQQTSRPTKMRGRDVIYSLLPTLVDILVPLAGYFLLRALGASSFWALTVGASVSIILVVIDVARRGRLSNASTLILLMFIVGISVTFLTHDPRILLVKPSIFFLVVAGYMLISCFTARPLLYDFIKPAAAAGDRRKAAAFELTYEQVPKFRSMIRAMTVFWAVTWIVESVVRVFIVYSFPKEQVGEALVWTVVAIFVLITPALAFTVIRGKSLKALGDASGEALDQDEVTLRARQVKF